MGFMFFNSANNYGIDLQIWTVKQNHGATHVLHRN